MMIRRKCFAVVVLWDGGYELLPHLLEHHANLGVDQTLVSVNTDHNDPKEVAKVGVGYDAQFFEFSQSPFQDGHKYAEMSRMLDVAGAEPDDWVIYCDLDEFHSYPCHLHELIVAMQAVGEWAIKGNLIDRIAADGSLPPIAPWPDLGRQYPLACNLAQAITSSWGQKVVLARRRVNVTYGHHNTTNAHLDRYPIGQQSDYHVHHFKWHRRIVEMYQNRVRDLPADCPYTLREYGAMLNFLGEDRKIKMNHPVMWFNRVAGLTYHVKPKEVDSQHFKAYDGEDKWIVEHLPLPKRGVFVDVGAGDGTTGSNSYYFEQHGWEVLAIEPEPSQREAFREARTCRLCGDAVGSKDGTAVLNVVGNPQHSSFVRSVGDPNPTPVEVRMRKLSDVLDEYNIDHVDVLSIDAEGTDLDVWAGLDLQRHAPRVVIIETHTFGLPDHQAEITDVLSRSGYVYVHRTLDNAIYVRV